MSLSAEVLAVAAPDAAPEPPALVCQNLSVAFRTDRGTSQALRGLDLEIAPGEAYGLVGESGSGKSTVALAIMRYLGRGAETSGAIRLDGQDLSQVDSATLRGLRGRRMAMVYQEPMASLNPVIRIGPQLVEVLTAHRIADARTARARVLRVLAEVELPEPEAMFERYPHQLSGGQQQRVVIAMALLAEPRLLILDEPTTGLDVTVEAAVLDLVDRLRRRHGTAVLFISHNLGAVWRLCDRVGVLYAGRLVEEGAIDEVLANPRHPYTQALLACVPVVGAARGDRPLRPIPKTLTEAARKAPGCSFAERCRWVEPGRCTAGEIPVSGPPGGHRVRCVRADEIVDAPLAVADHGAAADLPEPAPALVVEGLSKTYQLSSGLLGRKRAVTALTDADLTLPAGRTVAIVGESGSGKSTLARILLGLTTADAGHARLGSDDVAAWPIGRRPRALRQAIQMVFQNPDATLNPSRTIGATLTRTLARLRGLASGEAKAEAGRLLELVQLPRAYLSRYPDQLSGGQKQRVALARALAADPAIVLADEPVSALDVSVQASVVNLLNDLQRRFEVGLIFVSHDLALVRYMADAVVLLYRGAVVETGPAAAVFAPPYHPYTQVLLAAAPSLGGERPKVDPAAADPAQTAVAISPEGCRFSGRCPYRIPGTCETSAPPIRDFASGRHRIACHLPPDRLPDRIAA